MRRSPWLLLAIPLLLSGCGHGETSDGRHTVVAAAYPFQWLAEQIGGDRVHVVGLVKPGVEPHDVELTPGQVAELRRAKVVLYLKGFQPAVDDAVEGLPQAVDLGAVVHQVSGDNGLDPHVWLDPGLMKTMADDIATTLAQRITDVGPFSSRSVDSQLDQLDATFRSALTRCSSTDIVTSHAAFGYLAERYGLVQRGISGLSPDSEPSPKRLAQVADFARTHHVTTIFFESLVSPKIAQTVASEVGAQTAVLDPVEGVSGTDDYLSVQRRNALALHDALRCA